MPMPPRINYLHARECSGSPCTEVSWTPRISPRDVRAYPPDDILFQRQVYFPGGTEVVALHFPTDQSSYLDTDVLPGTQYMYRVRYYFEGMHSGQGRLFILTPAAFPWDCFVTTLRGSNCDD
jgi:hypothetical protein